MAIFYLWSSRLQEWLLCHASRSFTLVRWSQCHPASRQIFHGSRHSPFARQTSLRAIASSGITYWRRGKTTVENSQKSSDNMWEKQTHTHQGQSGRRERRCSRHWTRFPRSPGEEDGEAGCSPLTRESGADIHPFWTSDYMKEAVTVWRPHTGAGSWQNLWPCAVRSPCWGSFTGKICEHWGTHTGCSWGMKRSEPMLDQIVKNCSSWWGPTWEKLAKDCFSWEGPCTSSGEECEGSQLREGRSINDNMWWTDYRRHSPNPCSTVKRGERESEGEVLFWKKGQEEGRGCFKIWVYFLLFHSDVIGNKLK